MHEIYDNMKTETSASVYDRANGLLVSSIIVIGTIVLVLFLICLAMFFQPQPGVILGPVPLNPGTEKPEGLADDMREPGVEEFPEVQTSQLADSLAAITNAVSSVKASDEQRDGDADEMGRGIDIGSRTVGPIGPIGPDGVDIVPEHKRWKIEYDAPNITEYARQLSSFNIEIGVIASIGEEVIRLRQPGGQNQIIRSTRKAENKQLYFIHQKNQLRRWDESLVQQASVEVKDAFTVQFYPEATRQLLRRIEAESVEKAGQSLKDVLKTRYKVVPSGGGFSYEIVSVSYR